MSEPEPEPEPTLKPTEPATLVVAGLAAAAAAWLTISNFYQSMPPMTWPAPVLIAGIALAEGALAQQMWARIHGRGLFLGGTRRPGGGRGEPVEPLVAVRFALLGKASTLAGAILGGFYVGLVPWLVVEANRLSGAAEDLPPAVGGVVASGGLLAAGFLLERGCRVPPDSDHADERDRRDRRDRGEGAGA